MVTLRDLTPDDAPALQRIYSGASIRCTTGRTLTLGEAQNRIRAALAGAADKPRQRWAWGIAVGGELIGRIALRRRTPAMATLSYILREDTWGNGYATEAAERVVRLAFTTTDLNRLEAMHHPANPASGRVLTKAGFTRTGTSHRRAGDGTAVPYQVYAMRKP
ncbi:GNAT family N-acetyltransferase [Streptomyces sp. HB2AG]|uniref:GNAT family N-acetyltransferase n=1 Tax=Streptomyces sp. HB2AG TaxID=2983400 RepID=UPI0022AB172E|nr:GNAT family N-acetyltransferase [Streptomyces sp. HB2AG]MCZ2526978.1 GNAT family N-acetyltransferase [Streptomyces sp. HB2AG]